MERSLLRDVLAHAVPFQRGLAADVKSRDLLLEQEEAQVYRQRLNGAATDPRAGRFSQPDRVFWRLCPLCAK